MNEVRIYEKFIELSKQYFLYLKLEISKIKCIQLFKSLQEISGK
jgi:hypothetical protein